MSVLSGHRLGVGPSITLGVEEELVRDGLGARLWFDGRLLGMPELVAPALRRLGETARALGCRAELDEVRRLVAEGNGAVRRRDTHGRGGMPALLRSLRAVALTDAPAPALTAA